MVHPSMGRARRGRLDSRAGGVQGLRTLAIGTRVMDEQWLSEWDARYQEAAALLDGRDEATEELMEEVETDLELVGVSAIEDKLQDGVPAAIQTLLDAGIKVKMQHHHLGTAAGLPAEGLVPLPCCEPGWVQKHAGAPEASFSLQGRTHERCTALYIGLLNSRIY